MKVALISPERPFSGKVPMAPPILEYLGALTLRERPDAELRLIDGDFEKFDPDDIDADVVGISAMTATAPWAYRTADRLRARGVPVVLGGIHPSALPDEAALHADAVVTGEAESVWGAVLADVAAGCLKPLYAGERLPLDDLPLPMKGALPHKYLFRAVFTARGCPYRCTFCSVRRFFGDTVRVRPIDQVVEEVATRTGDIWFNGDDNIWGADTARSIRLFDALAAAKLGKHWYGFGDLRAVQGPDGAKLLDSAKASGLFNVWAGWESVDEDQLSAWHATGKQGRDRMEAVRRIKDRGIEVVLFMVFGGRQDDAGQFQRAVELADRLDVSVHPVLLTPLPGTELYAEYEPYLLPDIGWDRFNGTCAVFEHPDPAMTPTTRERLYYETALELLRLPRVLRHTLKIPMNGFPSTHIGAIMQALPMRKAMHRAYDEWRAANEGGS
jgi:radical SAM superfamily enzyme YgiQ (UPF0313 family)